MLDLKKFSEENIKNEEITSEEEEIKDQEIYEYYYDFDTREELLATIKEEKEEQNNLFKEIVKDLIGCSLYEIRECEEAGFLYKCEKTGKYYLDQFDDYEWENIDDLFEKDLEEIEARPTERYFRELADFDHSIDYFVKSLEDHGGGF